MMESPTPTTDNKRVPKRIVVCCDGTWYASDKGGNNLPSNVARMSRALKKVGVVEYGPDKGQNRAQVVYYQSGIGTGNLGAVDKMWQGAFGAGLDENVCSAYNFLVNNYAPGDDIFLFGFSRGAFTARAVAGLVCHAGLLKPHCMELFFDMYAAYRARKPAGKGQVAEHLSKTEWAEMPYKSPYETEEEAARNEKRPSNWDMYEAHSDQNVEIKVVGVWDTVGSLGLPEGFVTHWTGSGEKYKFHNTGLDPKIKHAFHALALDEHRGAFSPTLWYIPKETPEGRLWKETRLLQCWFPGYHANVGGGTTGEGKDDNDIDEITFAWMCDLVKPYLTFDRDAINLIIPSKTEMPPVKDYFTLGKRTVTEPKGKPAKPTPAKKPTVVKAPDFWGPSEKPSYAMGKLADTFGLSWKAAGGSIVRKPGEIKPLGDEGLPMEDVETREFMHPCVAYRWLQKYGGAPCPSLAPVKTGGWVYDRVETRWEHQRGEGNKGFVWVKWNDLTEEQIVEIPQYIVPKYEADDGIGSLERLLMPEEYQNELDAVNFGVEGNGLAITAI